MLLAQAKCEGMLLLTADAALRDYPRPVLFVPRQAAPAGKQTACRTMGAAEKYRALRRHGITVRKTIDALIATFCIENDFGITHNDRDFDHMEELPGLRVLRQPRREGSETSSSPSHSVHSHL